MQYFLFPYERVSFGSKVILYGMGQVGEMFLRQISLNHYCEIVCAVDCNHYKIKNSEIPVYSPEKLLEFEFDYVVIALQNATIAAQVLTNMQKMGLSAEKCIYGYTPIRLYAEDIVSRLSSINSFLQGRVGKVLAGLESFAQNEYLRRNWKDLENSWLYKKFCSLQENLAVYDILEPHQYLRVGGNLDGGYVIIKDVPYNGKILYAFGVGGDVTFEYQLAADGYEVFLYDHTVKTLPQNHDNFHFFKKGLIGKKDINQPLLFEIEDLLCENGHIQECDMLLKVDVEGYEIDVFKNMKESIQCKFSQIVMELHGLSDISRWDDIIEAMENLNRTHYIVHMHANNWSNAFYLGNEMISDAVELTLVRKDIFNFIPKHGLLLSPLDARCDNEARVERIHWQNNIVNE